MSHIPPSHLADCFTCPHCSYTSPQKWAYADRKAPFTLVMERNRRNWRTPLGDELARHGVSPEPKNDWPIPVDVGGSEGLITYLHISTCQQCWNVCLWSCGKLIFPDQRTAPPAHANMPPDIRGDYEEADSIATKSPRGAAGLLRLCVQKLVDGLAGSAKGSIDTKIALLVAQGMPTDIQQACDILRVTGNDGMHGLRFGMADDPKVVGYLFQLLNWIVDDRIAQPAKRQAVYQMIPQHLRDAIANRDAPKP